MGLFDWVASWFAKNEQSMTREQRDEIRRMLEQMRSDMNENINTSSRHTINKMESIMNMQNDSLRHEFETQQRIHEGQMSNVLKKMEALEKEFKKDKEKKAKEDDDLSEKRTASLEENMDHIVKFLMNSQFMGPSGGYGPRPSGSYGPVPAGSYGPGPSGGYGPGPSGGYGPGPSGGYGPGPSGCYGPGPSGCYGPGPSGGYGPGPCGVNYGPGPSGGYGPGPSGGYGPGPSGVNYGSGPHGEMYGPGPSRVGGGPGSIGRGGPRRPSLEMQRSTDRAKILQRHVKDFFNTAENPVSKDDPASLSRAAYSSNSKPMDLIMPESKDSPSAQSIGKCSETVQDWVNRNENPSKESEESENDGNSVSGRSMRSTLSTTSFVGKRVFTNDSQNNSNKSKTAAIKNKKSGKSRQKSTQNTASKQKNKTDEDKNASTLKSVSYPSEEEAMKKKLNLRDPLKTPVMFIGKKKDGSMESHQPKSLAELYELEKLYETFKVITL